MAITKPVDLWTMPRIAHRVHRTNSNSKPPCRDEKCVHHVPERPSTLSPVQTGRAGRRGRSPAYSHSRPLPAAATEGRPAQPGGTILCNWYHVPVIPEGLRPFVRFALPPA